MIKRSKQLRASDHPPGRRGCRRRSGCLLFVLLAALGIVVAFLVSDAVRRSQWLADLIIAQVQDSTGLVTTAADLRISWSGETTIESLTLSLPMHDEPTVTADRVRLTHDPLYLVVIKRSLGLRSIHVGSPVLLVQELTEADGAPGRWSGQVAIERLLSTLPQTDRKPTRDLPVMSITGGQLVLSPVEGERLTIPFTAATNREGPLGVRYELLVEGLAHVEGLAAVGAEWRHTLNIKIEPSQTLWTNLQSAFGLEAIEVPSMEAAWSGQLTANGVDGTLRLDHAHSGEASIKGTLRCTASSTVQVEPKSLTVSYGTSPAIHLRGGSIAFEGKRAKARGVEVGSDEHTATLDGTFDFETFAGDADLAFRVLSPGGIEHQGSASFELRTPAGMPVLTGRLRSSGFSPTASYRARADLSASGSSWAQMEADLEFPTLTITADDRLADLSGLRIRGLFEPDHARIVDAHIPNTEISSIAADFNFGTDAWTLDALLQGWEPTPAFPALEVVIRAGGAGQRIDDWSLRATDGRFDLIASGRLDPELPEPVLADGTLHIHQSTVDEAAPGASSPNPLLPRNMTADILTTFTLRGTQDPLRLEGAIGVMTTGVSLGSTAFEDLDLVGTATITAEGSRLGFEEFEAIQGLATISARTDWRGNIDAHATLTHMDLGTVANLLGMTEPMRGTVTTTVEAAATGGDLDAITATGFWSAADLILGPIEADSGSGLLNYADGVIRLDNIVLARNGGELLAHATVPLSDLTNVTANASADSYPVEAAGFAASVSGQAGGTLDLLQQIARIEIHGQADIAYDNAPIGSVKADGLVDGRTLRFDGIHGQIGDGQLTGEATIPLDDLTLATAKLHLTSLAPGAFARILPEASDIAGRVSGTLVLGPATDPRAPAPARLDVQLDLDGGGWRTVSLERLRVEAYIGAQRMVLERAVAEVAQGTATLWGSTSLHNSERFIQLAGRADGLDLAQLVSALTPDADEFAGRISAEFGGGGYLADQQRLFGNATVSITDSDLVNVPLMNQLYTILSVGSDPDERGGIGAAEIQLEGTSLRIPRVQYNSRGVQIRASLEVADIFLAADSPIAGAAVGIARPLSGGDTLISGNADRLLAAAQEGGSAVRIGGTLRAPDVRLIPFAELQNLVSRIFAPIGN